MCDVKKGFCVEHGVWVWVIINNTKYQLSPLGLKNPKLTFNFIHPINTDGEYAPGRSGDTHTEPLLSVCQDTALQLGQPLTKAHTFTKCDNTTVTWNKINHIFLDIIFTSASS